MKEPDFAELRAQYARLRALQVEFEKEMEYAMNIGNADEAAQLSQQINQLDGLLGALPRPLS